MKSHELYHEARRLIPGGVSSPVRAIRPFPFYTRQARGSHLLTEDGDELIDCCMGYGPLILGHGNEVVQGAIQEQLGKGWLYGTPTHLEPELARLITGAHPGMDMIRFVSTGGEATMSAIRLARGYSGKPCIIKAEGGFHGAHDGVLIKAGSGATTLGVPDSAGVLPEVAAKTLQVPYNDPAALEELVSSRDDIAAFILEPIMGNIGPVLPVENYLTEVRRITRAHDVLLIFDEVITGYRIGIGGAQVRYRVRPDLTTFGKIIGGGLPMGAFAGRREIMELVAPQGPVYQAGTYSGNPASLAAGIATLRWLSENREIYDDLDSMARSIGRTIGDRSDGCFVSTGSMFKFFFRHEPPKNYQEVKESDTHAFSLFWKRMLESGIFVPPSQFETNFLSSAHRAGDITQIGAAYNACLSG